MSAGRKTRGNLAVLYAWPVVLCILLLGLGAALVGQALAAGWSLLAIISSTAAAAACAVIIWALASLFQSRRARQQAPGMDEASALTSAQAGDLETVTDIEISARATAGLFMSIEPPPPPVAYPGTPVVHLSQRVLGATASYVVPVAGNDLKNVVRRSVNHCNTLVLSEIDDDGAHIGRRTTLQYGLVWIVLDFAHTPRGGTKINARSRSYADLGGGARELTFVLDHVKHELDLLPTNRLTGQEPIERE